MKGLVVACLLFLGSVAVKDSIRDEILSRRTSLFYSRPVGDNRGAQLGKSQHRRRKKKSALDADVSGYHVEFFQVFFLETADETINATQFGSWYEDDVNNATRVEVSTYVGNDIFPGEYMTINDVYYEITTDDNGEVVCTIGTAPNSNGGEYEYVGYAFVSFPEDSYPIIWGPRLVKVYLDPNTGESTKSYVGIDAFTDEPIFYSNYNETFENVFVWSRIHKEDVDATDFVVPDGIDCSSVDNDGTSYQQDTPWYDQLAVDISRQFRISTIGQIGN